ncbi:putative transcription factor interactor and regulator CCHC(Zn) family [Helianthus anomalus]
MNSKPSIDSAASVHSNPTSGIRATTGREEIPAITSTTLPCLHCSYEKKERRRFQRKCYYCDQSGHQIAECKKKDEDEATQLIRLAINTRTHSQKEIDDDSQNERSSEFMVTGTD